MGQGQVSVPGSWRSVARGRAMTTSTPILQCIDALKYIMMAAGVCVNIVVEVDMVMLRTCKTLTWIQHQICPI
jgi:hypothetical protein